MKPDHKEALENANECIEFSDEKWTHNLASAYLDLREKASVALEYLDYVGTDDIGQMDWDEYKKADAELREILK